MKLLQCWYDVLQICDCQYCWCFRLTTHSFNLDVMFYFERVSKLYLAGSLAKLKVQMWPYEVELSSWHHTCYGQCSVCCSLGIISSNPFLVLSITYCCSYLEESMKGWLKWVDVQSSYVCVIALLAVLEKIVQVCLEGMVDLSSFVLDGIYTSVCPCHLLQE